MFIWLARWVMNAIALSIVSGLVPGFHVTDFAGAMVAVAIMSLVNILVKPVLFLLTLPVTILTLGLFLFVINAMLFMLASSLSPGFEIDGFGAALIGSLLYSLIGTMLQSLIK